MLRWVACSCDQGKVALVGRVYQCLGTGQRSSPLGQFPAVKIGGHRQKERPNISNRRQCVQQLRDRSTTSMRKYFAIVLLVAPVTDGFAQYYFSVPDRSTIRYGLSIEVIPGPDSVQPFAPAREFCTQAATSAVIRFDDDLRNDTLSAFPKSPITSPPLPKRPWAFATVLPVPAPWTSYRFPQNRCVRGYDSSGKAVLVALPSIERIYTALAICSRMHGIDRTASHATCIETIAEHLE